jgi:AcrR family transcriptional regulator
MKLADHRELLTTKARLLNAGLALFAHHGVDGVGVRQITTRAGVKNLSAIRYYFGSKEGLVEAIMLDGARAFEEWRSARLQTLLQRGAPSARELMSLMLGPGPEDGMNTDYFILLSALLLHKPAFVPWRLEPSITKHGSDACWKHLKRHATNVSERILEQRREYISYCIVYTLARRAASSDRCWSSKLERERFIDALLGMLTAPCSQSRR